MPSVIDKAASGNNGQMGNHIIAAFSGERQLIQ